MQPATPTVTPVHRGPGWLDRAAHVLASGFGAGYSPLVPGTAGSAVGVLLFLPLAGRHPGWQLLATTLLFFAGVAASARVARRRGQEDPALVVVDEIVGQWLTLAALPFTLTSAVAGFILFRIMDVVKPWPARQFESFPGGWGIMADDVMAGLYANLALRLVLLVVAP
jgi:phosphatidylglycerophosphatase A